MQELKRRIKSVQPILKSKKQTLDHEIFELNKIREDKMQSLNNLRTWQQKYISGVDQVNVDRKQGKMDILPALEDGLDFVKEKWHQNLREVKKLEEEERHQTILVMEAKRNLKSIETLEERYIHQLKEWKDKAEQKELDEIAVSQFVNQSRKL
ncbi:MAG: hypothetical protein CMP10_20500 [Zetaproteobacteria bacterium]|nr:hypothetical protein [Pseudobdellovibrionaceae bacterium]